MSHSWGREAQDAEGQPPEDESRAPEPESVVHRLPTFGPAGEQYPKPPTAWNEPADAVPAAPAVPPAAVEPEAADPQDSAPADDRTQLFRDLPAPPAASPVHRPFWGHEPAAEAPVADAPPPFAAQQPLPGQEQYPEQPAYRGQEPYPDHQASWGQQRHAPQEPYPGQPPFAGQEAYPGQPPYQGQDPYPGQQPHQPAQPLAQETQPPFAGYPQQQGPPVDHPAQYPAPAEAGRHYAQASAPPVAPPFGQPSGAPSTFPQQPVTPARPARPEDLLVPNETPVHDEPASWGWRGRLNRSTGGLVKTKASAQETAVRDAIQRIQRGFSRPMTVVVVQPKGGAGKTPTTICLAAAFGAHRGGYVVGWDDNETRGTLAVRVLNPSSQTATAWDLLSDLDNFETMKARVGDLSHYVRAQPDAHFDALVSDDNPGNMSQIGEEEFHRLHQVLQRFYRMIVVDTGNNVRSPNWQAAVSAADLVVVVSSYQRDVGYSGSWVLDHLAQTGREELARNAVTVLTAADPTTDKTVRGQLVEHFTNRTRAVAEIPYDPALAHGGPIKWTDLAPATRNAWNLAGATVVDALVERDQREQAARRNG